jgi:transcriptional regulator of arginine metabolism
VTEILGTIAGDDTIFIVKKENVSEKAVMDKLSSVIDGMN